MIVQNVADAAGAANCIYDYFITEHHLINSHIAFGMNCAETPELVNFHVSAPVGFGPKIEKTDKNLLSEMKLEFRNWLIGMGFASSVDLFCKYLDKMYYLLIFLDKNFSNVERAQGTKQNSFEYVGLEKKLQKLENEYGIAPKQLDALKTMNAVRNVITHHNGRVEKRHCNKNSSLNLKWKGIQLEEEIDGDFTEIAEDLRNFSLKKGLYRVKIIMRERNFQIGERIELSPGEVADMLWSVSGVYLEIRDSFIDHTRLMPHEGQNAKEKIYVELPKQNLRAVPNGARHAT